MSPLIFCGNEEAFTEETFTEETYTEETFTEETSLSLYQIFASSG